MVQGARKRLIVPVKDLVEIQIESRFEGEGLRDWMYTEGSLIPAGYATEKRHKFREKPG